MIAKIQADVKCLIFPRVKYLQLGGKACGRRKEGERDGGLTRPERGGPGRASGTGSQQQPKGEVRVLTVSRHTHEELQSCTPVSLCTSPFKTAERGDRIQKCLPSTRHYPGGRASKQIPA